jgi:hypothetical protein
MWLRTRIREFFFQCRIKGKVLRDDRGEFIRDDYNPLTPGDRVLFDEDRDNEGQAMITDRLHRDNWFLPAESEKAQSPVYCRQY